MLQSFSPTQSNAESTKVMHLKMNDLTQKAQQFGVFAASRQQKDLPAFSCYRLQTSLAGIAVRIG